jgi:hypothetical protein
MSATTSSVYAVRTIAPSGALCLRKEQDLHLCNAVEQYRSYDLICLALLLPRFSAILPNISDIGMVLKYQRTSQRAGVN